MQINHYNSKYVVEIGTKIGTNICHCITMCDNFQPNRITKLGVKLVFVKCAKDEEEEGLFY